MPHFLAILVLLAAMPALAARVAEPTVHERMFEWTFESGKTYPNPFADVEVDVVFSKDGASWRVPAFWRGGQRWSVRFAPPSPGEFTYRLSSTDPANPALNGRDGVVRIDAYRGANELFRRGPPRVSADKRYFEHADGTPFYWLGDTWWTGLSGRLSREGFQTLTADRKSKGFTVVQIVGGLIPSNEEQAPSDPGFCNEGGCVYDASFERVNPAYFDLADRRIQYLIAAGITPAMVGGWQQIAEVMNTEKLKRHWRYLIARYGAYPLFWIVAGEVAAPPLEPHPSLTESDISRWKRRLAIWEEVTRYVRATDPYHHPVTLHEANPPLHGNFADLSLTDFDLVFPSHAGGPSLATEVAQVSLLHARTPRKPIVVGEIGYEGLGGEHLEDFQRMAFWLAMLNGAAGFTYGTIETAEAYGTDKPLHRYRWSFATWDEAMNRAGSAQVGLNAQLLRQYPWQRFSPHPEWVIPRGTTLFEKNSDIRQIELDVAYASLAALEKTSKPTEADSPSGEWKRRHGTFREPYAAGIARSIRMIYIPYSGAFSPPSPTVLQLEPGIRYRAGYWDPTLGIRIDLGTVERPEPGELIFKEASRARGSSKWQKQPGTNAQTIWLLKNARERNLSLSSRVTGDRDTALIFRYLDADNFSAASYSAAQKAIYISQRVDGQEKPALGRTEVAFSVAAARLSAEFRDGFTIVSIEDGEQRVTSPIVALAANPVAGGFGVMSDASSEGWGDFEARRSTVLATDTQLDRTLHDAQGRYRGRLSGAPEWDEYGKNKLILLDAYRPERPPFPQDWILILEASGSRAAR